MQVASEALKSTWSSTLLSPLSYILPTAARPSPHPSPAPSAADAIPTLDAHAGTLPTSSAEPTPADGVIPRPIAGAPPTLDAHEDTLRTSSTDPLPADGFVPHPPEPCPLQGLPAESRPFQGLPASAYDAVPAPSTSVGDPVAGNHAGGPAAGNPPQHSLTPATQTSSGGGDGSPAGKTLKLTSSTEVGTGAVGPPSPGPVSGERAGEGEGGRGRACGKGGLLRDSGEGENLHRDPPPGEGESGTDGGLPVNRITEGATADIEGLAAATSGGVEREEGREDMVGGALPKTTSSSQGLQAYAPGTDVSAAATSNAVEREEGREDMVGGALPKTASSWQGLQAYAPALGVYERATLAASVIGGAAGGIVAGPIGISAGEIRFLLFLLSLFHY